MALDSNTYGLVAGVERLIGDIIVSRTFTTGTTPTLLQAEAELDAAAMDLNRELDQAGYTVPVLDADFPTAYGFLKAANEYGASAALLATLPSEAYSPEEEIASAGESRAMMYHIRFQHALKVIREHKIRAAMRKGRLADMFAGSQETDAGDTKEPFFTRKDDKYPGSRVDTE